jgi:NAD(P)-dependent dehydrogenase (short-subunit alcohol dehydrogenase family)
MAGIRPDLGALFSPKKSIRAEENLFARDSAGDFSATAAGNPDEVAGAAMDFASPAASFTTDAILTIDGGSSNPIAGTL